jgi:hypothetical protein
MATDDVCRRARSRDWSVGYSSKEVRSARADGDSALELLLLGHGFAACWPALSVPGSRQHSVR